MKGKPAIGYPIFMAFPCDRIPEVTKDVHVHFFTHSRNSCKFTSQFRERCEAAAVGAPVPSLLLSFMFVYIPQLLGIVAL